MGGRTVPSGRTITIAAITWSLVAYGCVVSSASGFDGITSVTADELSRHEFDVYPYAVYGRTDGAMPNNGALRTVTTRIRINDGQNGAGTTVTSTGPINTANWKTTKCELTPAGAGEYQLTMTGQFDPNVGGIGTAMGDDIQSRCGLHVVIQNQRVTPTIQIRGLSITTPAGGGCI